MNCPYPRFHTLIQQRRIIIHDLAGMARRDADVAVLLGISGTAVGGKSVNLAVDDFLLARLVGLSTVALVDVEKEVKKSA